MRLSRRTFLIGGGAVATAALAGGALAQRPQALDEATAIPVSATPISRFSVTDPDRTRFGDLFFRAGLELKSPVWTFGGFSGLWRSPDGQNLMALADNAQYLSARVETSDGRLSGLSGAVLAPLLLESGKPLRRSRFYDTESFAVAGDKIFVGVERSHAVIRFQRDGKGLPVKGRPIAAPPEIRKLPNNHGLEAMAIAPPRSPLAGALVAIAERLRKAENAHTAGFIMTGPRQGIFELKRSHGYDISDLAFLPDGDALLLERRFSFFSGFAIRMRRVSAGAIAPGANVDGDVIFESDASQQIDNLEGLAVHREGNETVLTLISDDNFNPLQRTLLLEFALS